MASQLQNRIVGSVILIALAVIILPELFDGKPQQKQESFEAIPLQPEVEVAEVPAKSVPQQEKLPDSLDQVETLEIDADDAPAIKTAQKKTPDAPSNAELQQPGWIIQLGVFRNQASVDRLVKELRAAGYPAYREVVQTADGPRNKLLVGPGLVKEELEADLPKLKELTDLNGRVFRYEP
ncbi:SPOR domain-containing protein [Pseudidiomarina andamanensis]|uniref:SPOR domain-containing protein n=1 Tax=Pseudidiomarina andamanensis TaxID=1940690 RepID=A0AA92EUF3_9GAMM|nr:SPOR domain-containing protein [Pseudidiomarina andamanensis]MDS0217914.1 SPOR domain-containing protein [Pseudidiomarina andamanensis]QGT94809.1 SPOR domain-containing protein [Pseudidiomarina andamanensis]